MGCTGETVIPTDLISKRGNHLPRTRSDSAGTRADTDRVYGELQIMKLKPKMTPGASNVYRIRSDKETFDPGRGRTLLAEHFFYKHAIPLGPLRLKAPERHKLSRLYLMQKSGLSVAAAHAGSPNPYIQSVTALGRLPNTNRR